MWQSEANSTSTHCPPISAGSHQGCPSLSPGRVTWDYPSTLLHVQYCAGYLEGQTLVVLCFPFSSAPSSPVCSQGHQQGATGQRHLLILPENRDPCLLSPYSHDPVSPRHFSTLSFFLFVSALTIPLPPLHRWHLIFTFRPGGTEEAFPCIAPTLFPAGIWEQV